MNKSLIPSISLKRSRETVEFDSQLPRYKRVVNKSPLSEITNTVTSSPQISDSDCKMSAKTAFTPTNSGSSCRLMNKYYYGDPRVIEEVKRRERKVLKDIHHFKKIIDEIEREMKTIQENTIPTLRYELSKKASVYKDLRVNTNKTTTKLEMLTSRCEVLRGNNELLLTNMTLEQQLEVQNLENELDQKINAAREKWEMRILSLENIKFHESLVNEIEQLKKGKTKLEDEFNKVRELNKAKCQEYEKSLESDFKKFKDEKLELFRDLTDQYELLNEKFTERQSYADRVVNFIDDTIEKNKKLEVKIKSFEGELPFHEKNILPLELKLQELQSQYEREKEEVEIIKGTASKFENEYNILLEKMGEQELYIKKIENTIEELRGMIRCFVYVDEASMTSMVDYEARTIKTSDLRSYKFSKVISMDMVPLNNLFSQECQTYMDMCLSKNYNSTILLIQQERDPLMLSTTIEWIIKQKFYQAKLQCVMLSEYSVSSDVLLPLPMSSVRLEDESKVVIENTSVSFESRSVELNPELSTNDIINQMKSQNNIKGIMILRFRVWQTKDSFNDIHFVDLGPEMSHCVEECIQYTSSSDKLQIESKIELPINSSSSTPASSIAIILRKLLVNTKPLLLLTLKKEDQYLLDLSLRICQQKQIAC